MSSLISLLGVMIIVIFWYLLKIRLVMLIRFLRVSAIYNIRLFRRSLVSAVKLFFAIVKVIVSERWIRLIFFSRGFFQQLQPCLSGVVISLGVGVSWWMQKYFNCEICGLVEGIIQMVAVCIA